MAIKIDRAISLWLAVALALRYCTLLRVRLLSRNSYLSQPTFAGIIRAHWPGVAVRVRVMKMLQDVINEEIKHGIFAVELDSMLSNMKEGVRLFNLTVIFEWEEDSA